MVVGLPLQAKPTSSIAVVFEHSSPLFIFRMHLTTPRTLVMVTKGPLPIKAVHEGESMTVDSLTSFLLVLHTLSQAPIDTVISEGPFIGTAAIHFHA